MKFNMNVEADIFISLPFPFRSPSVMQVKLKSRSVNF